MKNYVIIRGEGSMKDDLKLKRKKRLNSGLKLPQVLGQKRLKFWVEITLNSGFVVDEVFPHLQPARWFLADEAFFISN